MKPPRGITIVSGQPLLLSDIATSNHHANRHSCAGFAEG